MHQSTKKTLLWIGLLVVIVLMIGCGRAISVKQVSPHQVYARLPDDLDTGLILLDVRTQEEWDEEHIEGATLIPLQELEDRATKELAKDSEIIIYCNSGNRSAQAAGYLASLGYTNLADMGGIIDWKDAGYPTISD